jgi:hypothetical protein
MISLIVFIAALLLFIGLFGQTVQTAIVYERHRAVSTKNSDLLDTVLLNTGIPNDWIKKDNLPAGFGLQDPDFAQYNISPFALARLTSTSQPFVYYPRTGTYYSNVSAGQGAYSFSPLAKSLNYSTASQLLGISSTYGFQLTLTPILTVCAAKVSSGSPLTFSINVDGMGSPLANAKISYSLIIVNQDGNVNPSFTTVSGKTIADQTGSAPPLTFAGINGDSRSYALIVYAYLDGLKGMGYCVHNLASFSQSIVPLIGSFENKDVILAHSDAVGLPPQNQGNPQLNYNASFDILSEDYTLRQVQLNPSEQTGTVAYGSGVEQAFGSVTVPDNEGILIVTYKSAVSGQCGIVLMPWGLSSLAFPVIFGGNSHGQEWVTSDMRQVTIGGIAYQAKLAIWSINGSTG